ncbi:hypothetical protein ABPG72_021937 [Tetrahymena utriculariae]
MVAKSLMTFVTIGALLVITTLQTTRIIEQDDITKSQCLKFVQIDSEQPEFEQYQTVQNICNYPKVFSFLFDNEEGERVYAVTSCLKKNQTDIVLKYQQEFDVTITERECNNLTYTAN